MDNLQVQSAIIKVNFERQLSDLFLIIFNLKK